MLLSIKLSDYNPLMLKGVKSIELRPIKYFNIILARNGYGKTSILRECTPLPPDNAKYGDKGYKCVEYRINNDHYKLESWTGKKSTHYFYLNGENLNKGNTLLVQRELVKIHFGVTNDIKNVLMGLDKADVFSSLTPQRRKYILMEINPNDTKYLLTVYDKLKKKHNQVKGVLKHQRQRLLNETRRQEDLNLIPIEELEYEVKLLDEQIKDALLLHGELKHVTDPDLERQNKKIGSIAAKMLSENMNVIFPMSHWVEIKDRYEKMLDSALFRKKYMEEKIHEITDQLNDAAVGTETDLDGYRLKIDNLKTVISDLNLQSSQLQNTLNNDPFFINEAMSSPDVVRLIPEIMEHLTNIDYINDEEMNAVIFNQLLDKEKALNKEIAVTENHLEQFKHRLDHFNSVNEITCPKCKAGFKPGFEHVSPGELRTTIDGTAKRIEKLIEERKELKDQISNNEGWYYSMLGFMRYIKNTPVALLLVDMVKHFKVGKGSPSTLLQLLETVLNRDNIEKDIAEKEKEKEVLLVQYKLLNKDSIKSLYHELAGLNHFLAEEQIKIKNYLVTIKESDRNIDLIKAENVLRDSFLDCFDETMEMLAQKGKYALKVAITEKLGELTPRKNALTTKLIKSQSLVSVIDDIEEQVKILEDKEKNLAFLLESLSPTKGLIGHLMLSFLDTLCKNANAIIERIWHDPLKLTPPSIDDENKDLDYKFKVITTDKNKPIQDIKECSGGEKEVIDFALRYTLMRFTNGKTGIPLCLDEIGAAFDELHKRSYANYILTEKRARRLPQTFLISHFVTQYSAFNPSDINLVKLNTTGLNTPENGNENTIIN